MDRLALFKLLSFHVFLRSCASNLAGTSRVRTEAECVNLYVCVGVCSAWARRRVQRKSNWQESGE